MIVFEQSYFLTQVFSEIKIVRILQQLVYFFSFYSCNVSETVLGFTAWFHTPYKMLHVFIHLSRREIIFFAVSALNCFRLLVSLFTASSSSRSV